LRGDPGQFDAIVATDGGVEIRCRGKESGIGLLEVRLPSADAVHPRRDRVVDERLGRHVAAGQRGVDDGADAVGTQVHE
jgi:hypothetical protein